MKKFIKKFAATFLSLCLLLSVLPAFTASAISYSSTLSVGYTQNVSGTVTFRFVAPYSGTFEFYSTGSVDTKGTLYNSSGSAIDSDDDNGNSLNFFMTRSLYSGQTVYLTTQPYSSSNTESYGVRVDIPGQDLWINTNYTVSGYKRFDFTASSAGTYKFFSTGSVDTVGNLYTAYGDFIISDDDDGAGSNFYIEYNLDAGESVQLTTYPYTASNTSSYTVRVEPPEQIMLVNTNYTISGANDFSFTAPRDGVYQFFSTGSVDTKCTLYDSSNYELGSDDDDGDGANFFITCSMSAGETVYLHTEPYSASNTSSYTVRVSYYALQFSNYAMSAGTWYSAIGNSSFTFTAPTCGVYVFASSGSLDTRAYLYNSSGYELEFDDDDGDGSNFYIARQLTKGQRVTLSTMPYNSSNNYTAYNVAVARYSTTHTSPTWVTTKAATFTKAGKKVYKCTSCNTVIRSETIPKLSKVKISKTKITINNVTYNGKSQKPTVTVKFNGKKLKKNKDYTLSYKNNKKVGKATVTIKGKGNFTGSVKKTFTIKPKKVKGLKVTNTYDCGRLTIKWSKASGISGYQIQYSPYSDFSYRTKTVTVSSASTTKLKVRNLDCSTRYYVRIRAYKTVKGKKYYSSYCSKKSKSTN